MQNVMGTQRRVQEPKVCYQGKSPRGGGFRLESKMMNRNEFESRWLDPLREGISGTGEGIPKAQTLVVEVLGVMD